MFNWDGIDDNSWDSRDDVVGLLFETAGSARWIENGNAVASESGGLDLLFDFGPAEQRLSLPDGLRLEHLAEAAGHGALADGVGAGQR